MRHTTPLATHFRDKHIWLDMGLLALLCVVAAFIPILKIVPLVAGLELFSFFCFHLAPERSRFQLQGFLGGFISSTAVYLQVLNDKKFAASRERDLRLTLLFALCAMLLECLMIVWFLSGSLAWTYYLPFLIQLLLIVCVIVFLNARKGHYPEALEHDNAGMAEIELLNDHPILWKNVLKLSALIFILVYGMHFIGSELELSRNISTLLISLFEAHAVLASVMTEQSLYAQPSGLLTQFFLILCGNALSKSFLVYKGTNLKQKVWLIGLLLSSFLFSLGLSFTISAAVGN
ncbi:DUF4010 domain-containing protein [Shewanella cyperi]|uniref:DUF4010 domain-containing protein n=1 Tax=Shewanella cyperi TaxID=2814292 RepID=A0A975AJ44_9GAMM|nr:DUF4010 domain-containing protein [Shewanella cyperi]QSX28695.1 DUF4010 domain-containing protein [Shewanella cyperi]